ncbi:MAG: hypothetical protein AAF633_25540, partial [Chloroflexota bacterium]
YQLDLPKNWNRRPGWSNPHDYKFSYLSDHFYQLDLTTLDSVLLDNPIQIESYEDFFDFPWGDRLEIKAIYVRLSYHFPSNQFSHLQQSIIEARVFEEDGRPGFMKYYRALRHPEDKKFYGKRQKKLTLNLNRSNQLGKTLDFRKEALDLLIDPKTSRLESNPNSPPHSWMYNRLSLLPDLEAQFMRPEAERFEQLLKHEGPIHHTQFDQIMSAAYGYQVTTQEMQKFYNQVKGYALAQNQLIEANGWLYLPTQPPVSPRNRLAQKASFQQIEVISDAEILALIKLIRAQHPAIDHERLKLAITENLGVKPLRYAPEHARIEALIHKPL